MIFDTDFKNLADELIGDINHPCTVTTKLQSGYDPATSRTTDGGTRVRNAYCVEIGISSDYTNTAGVQVVTGDKMFLLTADADVKVGDLIRTNGTDWRVVNVIVVAPDGNVIMYKAQVRK